MKRIKLFEAFIASGKPSYKKPEYEFKEFYRAFRNNPELREILPDDIDVEIFDVKGTGFNGEPEWIDTHCDPPSKPGEITTPELIELAEVEDTRFIPLIQFCQELFESGKMEKLALSKIIPNLESKFKNHEWDLIQKNPDYLKDCEKDYMKLKKLGLNDDEMNQKGLVQKFPDVDISKAQFWALYAKNSISYFDSVLQKGGEIPCTQFILHNGIYYTIGGRRRMFWHFYNEFDPTVWLIAA